jgi:hypothetical protein
MPFDMTVIVNCSSEGRFIHATTRAVEAAVLQAEATGLSVEWLFTPENPTEALDQYFQKYLPPKARVVPLKVKDGEDGRNEAVRAASGSWVSLIDATHLWSSDWLSAAFNFVNTFSPRCIAHSELKVYFGPDTYYARNIDQESGEFSVESLFEHNYWNASTFAARETYIKHPFCKSSQAGGGQDWNWNCSTVAAGILHKVVPGTIHAVRSSRSDELLKTRHSVNKFIPEQNDLFQLSCQKNGTSAVS